MTIYVISSSGSGKTLLSAFDNALKNAGVFNYNIIPLSSIIPSGVDVVKQKKFQDNPAQYGHRLYVVKADIRSSQSDKVIAAGLGWYFISNSRGAFVEHTVEADTAEAAENELRYKIFASLEDLCTFRNETYNRKKVNLSLSVCPASPNPRCALTVAIYKSEPW